MIVEFPRAHVRNIGEADAMPEPARLPPSIAIGLALLLSLALWAGIYGFVRLVVG